MMMMMMMVMVMRMMIMMMIIVPPVAAFGTPTGCKLHATRMQLGRNSMQLDVTRSRCHFSDSAKTTSFAAMGMQLGSTRVPY